MPHRRESGLTLTEIVIAVGLLSILAAGFMKLSELNFRSTRTTAVNYELASLKDEIRQLISDSSACKNTFAGIRRSTTDTNPFNITTPLKKKDNTALYAPNTLIRDGTLKITSIQLGTFAPDAVGSFTGTVPLTLKYQKQGLIFGGTTVTQDPITLNVTLNNIAGVDQFKILSCSTKSDPTSGDCGSKLCVRAEIEKATGSGCFETTGTCTGDYLQASSQTKKICTYVIKASTSVLQVYELAVFGSASCPLNTPGSYLPMPPITYPAGTANVVGGIAVGTTSSGTSPLGDMQLLQTSAFTVNTCCRKFPP